MNDCLSPDVAAWVDQLNHDRIANGLNAVTTSAALMRCALDYAELMASADHFSHTGPDGSSPRDRMTRAGYPTDGGWGEILLYGQPTWEAAYNGWWNSPAHRAVMLTPGLTEVGLAFGIEPDWDDGSDVYLAACAVFGGSHTAPARRCEVREQRPEREPRVPREPRTHLPKESPPRQERAERLLRRWLRWLWR